MAAATHEFREHTGEIRLHVEATSIAELFAEAARALASLLAEPTAWGPRDADDAEVVVRSPDREALLVDWLNELVWLGEVKKRVFPEIRVEVLTDREMRAFVRGISPTSLRTAVKAATMHDVRIGRGERGWEAAVVLDV
jgi:SHS2 domain-containing protein